MCGVVEVNRLVVWANVVELDDGLRMHLSLADWRKTKVSQGQQIPVRLPGRTDMWLVVEDVIELSPNVLVTMTLRLRAVA